MIVIPLDAIPWQAFNIVLDGQKCAIEIRQIAQNLYCDLTVNDIDVFKGRICEDRASINLYPTRYFSGNLIFIDTRGKDHPQYEGLGTRWILVYVSEDE